MSRSLYKWGDLGNNPYKWPKIHGFLTAVISRGLDGAYRSKYGLTVPGGCVLKGLQTTAV